MAAEHAMTYRPNSHPHAGHWLTPEGVANFGAGHGQVGGTGRRR